MDIINKALKKEYITYFMVGIIVVIGLLNVFLGEINQVGKGLGYDGKFYGRLATNFVERVMGQQIDEYRIQRIIPSGIVYSVFSLFKIPLSIPNIIRGFEFLNVFLLAISVWLYGLIANELKISTKGKWLGFIALFVNFCFLKQYFYFPVQTDITAFALGMFMLLAYFKDMPIALWMLTFVGSFTWPNLLYCGIILIVFPRRTSLSASKTVEPLTTCSHFSELPTILARLTALLWLILVAFFYYFTTPTTSASYYYRDTPLLREFINLSILIVGVYVFLITKPFFTALLNQKFDLRYFFSWSCWVRIAFALFLFIVVKFFIIQLSVPATKPLILWFIRLISLHSIGKPFVFGLTSILLYGPIIFIAAFVLRDCSHYVVQYGLGISLLWLMGLVMTINPDSRQYINLFPIFVIFTIKVLDELPLTKKFYIFFFTTSFLLSQVYITLNTGFDISYPRWYFGKTYLISDEMYLAQGVIVSFIIFFFYFEFFKKPPFTNRNTNFDKEIA